MALHLVKRNILCPSLRLLILAFVTSRLQCHTPSSTGTIGYSFFSLGSSVAPKLSSAAPLRPEMPLSHILLTLHRKENQRWQIRIFIKKQLLYLFFKLMSTNCVFSPMIANTYAFSLPRPFTKQHQLNVRNIIEALGNSELLKFLESFSYIPQTETI